MLKFLRKYNKWILVFGGVLLMVAWTLQGTMNRLASSPKGPVIGTLAGRKVRYSEIERSTAELKWSGAFFFDERTGRPTDDVGQFVSSGEHWWLLVREAEAAGLLGGEDQARTLLATIGWGGRTDAEIVRAASASSLAPVLDALAKRAAIHQLLNSYLFAARVSDVRLAAGAKKMLDSARVRVVALGGDHGDRGGPDPTEDELRAHFDRFRDADPASAEFGIGYRLPDCVRLEWLKIDATAIRTLITLDPIEVDKRWRQQRSKYPGEFAVERPRVEGDLRTELTNNAVLAAEQVVRAEVLKATTRLPAVGDYRVIPADWADIRPRPEDIAAVVAAQTVPGSPGARMPLPEVARRDAAWLTAQDLTGELDLILAQVQVGPNSARLYQLPFAVRELAGDLPLKLQVGVPMVDYPGVGPDGSRYFLTVLDARKPGPADSLDDVRARATADFKRLRGYESLVARAEELRAAAVAGGLDAVSTMFAPPANVPEQGPSADPADPSTPVPEPVVPAPPVLGPLPVSRQGNLSAAVDSPAFRDAVLEAASRLDPLTPAGELPAEGATLVVPIPELLTVAVVRVETLQPVTEELLRIQAVRVATDAMIDGFRPDPPALLGDAIHSGPLGLAALTKRHQWKPATPDSPAAGTPDPSSTAGAAGPPDAPPSGS